MMDFIHKILDADLFKGVSEGELMRLLSTHNYQIKKFPSGSMILQSGEDMESLYVLISGIVKGEMVDGSGKVVKIEDIQSPAVPMIAFIFGKNNKAPVNMVAVSDVELLVISKQNFVSIMQKSEAILQNFLNLVSGRTQFLASKIRFLAFKTIREKIIHYLLSRIKKHDLHTVVIPVSQQELSEIFGVTRPSLSRAISELEKEGLISVNRREIQILDKEKLMRINNSL